MKLWQKLYIVLIVPILIILNIAIYLLFGITYRQNIQAEKNQAIGDFGMIIDQIYGEIQSSQMQDTDIKKTIQKYTNYYSSKKLNWDCGKERIKRKSIIRINHILNISKKILQIIKLLNVI